MKIIKLMEGIKTRPGMYFATGANITSLESMIDGILIAESKHKVTESVLEFDVLDFEIWVRKKLKEKPINIKSFNFARQRCKDEQEAFYLWFEWYDEYKGILKDDVRS